MNASPTVRVVGQLREFLTFVRPQLMAELGIDEARLMRLRQLLKHRVHTIAARHHQVSLAYLCSSLSYSGESRGFASLAVEGKLLSLEQTVLPLEDNAHELAAAVDTFLLQNLIPSDRLLEMIIEFTEDSRAARALDEDQQRQAAITAPIELPQFALSRKSKNENPSG